MWVLVSLNSVIHHWIALPKSKTEKTKTKQNKQTQDNNNQPTKKVK